METEQFLLDTHSLLWWQGNANHLSNKTLELISSPESEIYFSQISLYEIAIKQKLGKLSEMVATILEIHNQAVDDGFKELRIENSHIMNYSLVPLFQEHRDPFDRLLIAQAVSQNLPIITIDPKFNLYSNIIKVVW